LRVATPPAYVFARFLSHVYLTSDPQAGADVERLKKVLAEHNEAAQTAHQKQKAAEAETAKLEKDMAEFKNNKEGKIDELKVSYFADRAISRTPLMRCSGQHQQTEGGTPEADDRPEDACEGGANGRA
jgi:hypothetical protein